RARCHGPGWSGAARVGPSSGRRNDRRRHHPRWHDSQDPGVSARPRHRAPRARARRTRPPRPDSRTVYPCRRRYDADGTGKDSRRSSRTMTPTAVSPGLKSSAEWIAVEQATFMPNRRPPMVIERGQGSRVWDVEGREYLDMIAGIAVVSLGHSSPVVQRALAEQSARLIHISNLFYSIPQLELAQLLISHSPFDRVFFGTSGA